MSSGSFYFFVLRIDGRPQKYRKMIRNASIKVAAVSHTTLHGKSDSSYRALLEYEVAHASRVSLAAREEIQNRLSSG
jgi:hypothetical protein